MILTTTDTQAPNRLIIDLEAISYNIEALKKQLSGHVRIMAILKAQGYGTSPTILSEHLHQHGIDIIGVAHLSEALHLIENQVPQEIFLMSAFEEEWETIITHNIQLAVSSLREVSGIAEVASKLRKTVKLHLHVDTGMTRFGCLPEEASYLLKQIIARPNLRLEGIMTHFTSADCPVHDPYTESQMEMFGAITQKFQQDRIAVPHIHASNSATVLRFESCPYNMVRIGLALFGIGTSSNVLHQLKPALTLKTRLLHINICKKGESVSYLKTFTADSERKIGVLPIGYAHGFSRHFSNKGTVLICGKKAPIVGNVTMNYTMIDLTDIPDANIGDTVTLFGKDHAIESLAEKSGTIPHEIITSLSTDIVREFQHGY